MATPRITVVGLGPAGSELLTAETAALFQSGTAVWLRTSRHPAAADIDAAGSFDHLYETLNSFEDVYSTIVETLIELAQQDGHVIYAVPGSPVVAERTVELLRAAEPVTNSTVDLNVRPALAFTELCWTALGIDPMAEAATIIDAFELSVHGTGRLGPLLVTQVHSAEVLSEMIDVLDDVAPPAVTVLARLGSADALVQEVPWAELRTAVDPDHLTSLWIPRFGAPLASALVQLDEDLRNIVANSDRAAFSLESVCAGLPQATDSVANAISLYLADDHDAQFDLEDGLADLLVLVMLHVRLSAEAGIFTLDDLADTAQKKKLALNVVIQ